MEKYVYLVHTNLGVTPQDSLRDCLLQVSTQIGVERGEISLYRYGLSYQDTAGRLLCRFERKEMDNYEVIVFYSEEGDDYSIYCDEISDNRIPHSLLMCLGFELTASYPQYVIDIEGSKYIEEI